MAGALDAFSRPDSSRWFERIEARRRELASREDAIPRWGRPWLPDRTALVPEGAEIASEPLPVARLVQASKGPPWCRVLYELVRRLAPRHVVELGTNLGISGCYLAAALKDSGGGRLTTLEGSPHKAEIASKSLEVLGLRDGVEIVVGDFADTVDGVVDRLGADIGVAFIDGFHQREATLAFHETFVEAAGRAVLVYDDIRWSSGMLEAWRAIRADARVNLSVDAHVLGLTHVGYDASPLHLEWPPPG
ncbi:MAG TPA: class I SAM-dependent methyltransferase [Longimicrobiales bacterium]|nr:class I SAM-dependent methyltransferase [Longimicrobiales bacterium]